MACSNSSEHLGYGLHFHNLSNLAYRLQCITDNPGSSWTIFEDSETSYVCTAFPVADQLIIRTVTYS